MTEDSRRPNPTTETDKQESDDLTILDGDEIFNSGLAGFFNLNAGTIVDVEIDRDEEEPIKLRVTTQDDRIARKIELPEEETSTGKKSLNNIVFVLTTTEGAKAMLHVRESRDDLKLLRDKPEVLPDVPKNPLNAMTIFTEGRTTSTQLSRKEVLLKRIADNVPTVLTEERYEARNFAANHPVILAALAPKANLNEITGEKLDTIIAGVKSIKLTARATPRTPTPEPGAK